MPFTREPAFFALHTADFPRCDSRSFALSSTNVHASSLLRGCRSLTFEARMMCRSISGLLHSPNRRMQRVASGIRIWRSDRDAKERSPRDTHLGDVGVTIRGLHTHSTIGHERQPSLGGITAGRVWCTSIPRLQLLRRVSNALSPVLGLIAPTHQASTPSTQIT
jgi:hypothetical protein